MKLESGILFDLVQFLGRWELNCVEVDWGWGMFFCICPIRQQQQLGAKKATLLMGLAALVSFALDSTAVVLVLAIAKKATPSGFFLSHSHQVQKKNGRSCLLAERVLNLDIGPGWQKIILMIFCPKFFVSWLFVDFLSKQTTSARPPSSSHRTHPILDEGIKQSTQRKAGNGTGLLTPLSTCPCVTSLLLSLSTTPSRRMD
jgi:hypothetical protein